MKVIDYFFHSYYHQYITIEADDLTDKMKDRVTITEEDCYALCTGYCREGELMFAVLSVGSTWENCTKGLDDPDMLGVFTMEEVCEKTARIVNPDKDILKKGSHFLMDQELDDDDEVKELRLDSRLDNIRDAQFPDIVDIGIVEENRIVQAKACLLGTEGVFVHAVLVADPDNEEEIGYEPYQEVWALPGLSQDGMCLLAVIIGNEDPSEIQKMLASKAKELSDKFGITYNNSGRRS